MTDSNRRVVHAALVAALIASPVFAASDPAALEQQLNALQQALTRQQEQLAQQQQEIERLRQHIANEVQQAKLATQDAPRVTMTSARPTISSADARSSIALRSVVQLDAANYAEDADRGASDFRRGSVGAAANRETAAARDFSNGAYFRRARFGFEGTVARDFTYRVLAELGGSGTEGRGGIQDIWTFGVNWYINTNVKLMLNWRHIDVDRLNPAGAGNLLPFGPTPATPPLGVQIGQDLDIYGLRTQYSF